MHIGVEPTGSKLIEFSAMWNSFLGNLPDPEQDIAVSDRLPSSDAWRSFKDGLWQTLREVNRVLSEDGMLLVTFNNRDIRAWKVLLSAVQSIGLMCAVVWYQHPAVVSAKAQLARSGSYVGDFYCAFRRARKRPTTSLDGVERQLRCVAAAHEGSVPASVVSRVALSRFLADNVSADLLAELSSMTDILFETGDGAVRKWRGGSLPEGQQFDSALRSLVVEALGNGSMTYRSLYALICEGLSHLGVPDPEVVRLRIENLNLAVVENDSCRLVDDDGSRQSVNGPTTQGRIQLGLPIKPEL